MVIPLGLVIGFIGALLLIKSSYPRRKEIPYLATAYYGHNPVLLKNLIINRWTAVGGSIWLSIGFLLQLVSCNLYFDSILNCLILFALIPQLLIISWSFPSYMVRYQYCPPDNDDTIKDIKSNRLLLLNNGLEPDEKSKGEKIPDKERKKRIENAKRLFDGLGRNLLIKRKPNETYPDYCQGIISRLEKNKKRYR